MESILSNIEMKMQESQIDKVLNSTQPETGVNHGMRASWGSEETQLSVTPAMYSFRRFQQFTGFPNQDEKKQNHEESNI